MIMIIFIRNNMFLFEIWYYLQDTTINRSSRLESSYKTVRQNARALTDSTFDLNQWRKQNKNMLTVETF